MAQTPLTHMFSKDTPSSDFDDFDLTTMLSCSPALPHLHPLTPESCSGSYSSIKSSDSIYHLDEFDLAEPEEISSGMVFSQPPRTAFYHHSLPAFQEPLSYASGSAYSMYEQHQNWAPLHPYGQMPALTAFSDAPPSSIYPAFETPCSGGAAASQSISESFNFNTLPQHTIPSDQFPSQSPALSQVRHVRRQSQSHTESQTSTSRSASPSPSLSATKQPRASSLSTSTSLSAGSSSNLLQYGIPVNVGSASGHEPHTWRCAYPGCTSRTVFTRGCDLRKHFNRHSKHLFCRVEGCPQSAPREVGDGKRGSISATGGFSSKKDRARHEAKHNPGIRCEWRGTDGEICGRVFSRMDNMKDHVRRIHRKGSR